MITNNQIQMENNLIQHIPKPILIYDVSNLKFLEANEAAHELYGYTREQFLEIDLTDLYTPEDIQTLIETSDNQTLTGTFAGPLRHKTKDGKLIFVEISRSKIEFKGKKAHLNIINDITEEVNHRLHSRFSDVVLEFSDQPILRIDTQGLIISTNKVLRFLLGLTDKEIEGKPFLNFVEESERDKVSKLIDKLKEKDPIKTEFSLKHEDWKIEKTEFKFIPIFDFDKTVNSYAVIVKPPKELKIENTEIQSIEEQKDKETASKNDGRQSQGLDSSFLSHLFHEILTPINVIIGFGQEIVESIESPSKEQLEWKEIIDENQEMLLQILNIAAEYANLETSEVTLKPEKFAFVHILDEVESNIR